VLAGTVPPMTTDETLADRWTSRDKPVLMEFARRIDDGETAVDSRQVAAHLDLDEAECARVAVALADDGYLKIAGKPITAWGSGPVIVLVADLTGKGRRATGIWPDSDDAVERLLQALRQAEDLADDPDDKTALQKAGGQLASVSRNVLAEVIAAVVTRQAGL
jgi:hypothetical protein